MEGAEVKYLVAEEGLRMRPIRTKLVAPFPSMHYLKDTWEDEPLTPAGQVFVQPSFNCLCFCVLGFKNSIDVPIFKQHLQATLVKHKRFSSCVAERNGKPWWRQVTVNLDDHVHEVNLPSSEARSIEFVLDYGLNEVFNLPLDKSKPLWDCHVLNETFGEASGSCIFRIHHSLGDGISLMSLLMALTRKVEKPDELPTIPHSTKKNGWWHESLSFKVVFSSVWTMLIVLWHTLLDIASFMAMSTFVKDSDSAIKGSAGVESLSKKCRVATIELKDMKMIGKALGATINDLCLGILSYGLKQYLEDRAYKDYLSQAAGINALQRADQEETESKGLPKVNRKARDSARQEIAKEIGNYRVRALALINTRASPGLHELEEMMKGGSQARWGNSLGYLLIPFNLKSYKDPLDWVRWGKSLGDRKKLSFGGLLTYMSGELMLKLLGVKEITALTYRSATQTSFSISNIMGPSQEVMLFGNPITHLVPTVVGHPHALCIHMQSYNGKMTFVATTARDIIPDPEVLVQSVVDAFQVIKEEVGGAKSDLKTSI